MTAVHEAACKGAVCAETSRAEAPCEGAGKTPRGGVVEAPLLQVENLSVSFVQYGRGLRQCELEVISNLSLEARAGEIVAVVGASGSGKSLLAHAILGILPENSRVSGALSFEVEPLTPEAQARLRGSRIAFIPQSVECLDPLMRVGVQVRGLRHSRAEQRAIFKRYGLDESVERLYPFELSGGMARRVLVSTAVIEDADLIVADEPTPGLTHEMAVEAMRTFRDIADAGKAVVVITHDLDLAYDVADRIVVFYAGTTLEVADAADFRDGPDRLRHPYSKALWAALPQNGFVPVPGSQPYAGDLPEGCLYAARCPLRTEECTARGRVPMREVRGGKVRCVHVA